MGNIVQTLMGHAKPYTHSCPECGAATRCDLKNGKSVCWCMYEEWVRDLDIEESTKCLCRRCLNK